MPRPTDTIAALATPAGTAALAVVRASGPDTVRLAREIFGETPPPRVATHADYHGRAGMLLDDVLFTFFHGPRSYTGEDSLEVPRQPVHRPKNPRRSARPRLPARGTRGVHAARLP
jgi:tRNA modification GTPase